MSRAQAVRGSPALCLHRSGAAPDSLDRAKPVSPRNFPARHGPENSGGRKASQKAVQCRKAPQKTPQGVTGRGPQGAAGRGAARRRRRRCSAARRRRRRRKASQAAVPQGAADRGGPQGAACAGLRAAGAGRCWHKYAANHAEFRRRQHL